MNIELSKEDLINMVKGVSPSSINECMAYEKRGLMNFTGNQHNPNWGWVTSELEKMTEEKLFNLYLKHK